MQPPLEEEVGRLPGAPQGRVWPVPQEARGWGSLPWVPGSLEGGEQSLPEAHPDPFMLRSQSRGRGRLRKGGELIS